MKKNIWFFTAFFVALLAGLTFYNIGAGAVPKTENPATDVERGIFIHYPKAKGGAGTLPATDQVNDFKYGGVHWLGANPQVTYRINTLNPGNLAGADVAAVIQTAFNEWVLKQTDGDSNVNFVYGGLTAAEVSVNPVRDGLNTASFEPLNSAYPNAIAVTFYWYNRITKGVVEADTVFNSDLPWSINPYGAAFSGSYDLQNIATHEFGHWLVLGDLYNSRDAELTMYGYGATGETKKDTLGKGDISGIHKAY